MFCLNQCMWNSLQESVVSTPKLTGLNSLSQLMIYLWGYVRNMQNMLTYMEWDVFYTEQNYCQQLITSSYINYTKEPHHSHGSINIFVAYYGIRNTVLTPVRRPHPVTVLKSHYHEAWFVVFSGFLRYCRFICVRIVVALSFEFEDNALTGLSLVVTAWVAEKLILDLQCLTQMSHL